MIDRAYKINSNYKNLCIEFDKLRKFFCQNGFGIKVIDQCISKKMDSVFQPPPIVHTVSKQIIYCKIPYMSNLYNTQFKSDVLKLVSDFFPQVNLRLIFFNDCTISSFFPYKDVIPAAVKSNIVYKYECRICYSTYYGESHRHFRTRVAEHRGISSRTGNPLASSNKSNVFSHYLETGHEILPDDFQIIQTTNAYDLKTAESISIHRFKPSLNEMVSSVPLNILN